MRSDFNCYPALSHLYAALPENATQRATHPDVDETVLGVEISHGRRLAALPNNYDEWARLAPEPVNSAHECPAQAYIEAMASLLLAATFAGHDAVQVVQEAYADAHTAWAQGVTALMERVDPAPVGCLVEEDSSDEPALGHLTRSETAVRKEYDSINPDAVDRDAPSIPDAGGSTSDEDPEPA